MSFFFDPDALRDFISGLGLWAPVVFLLLQVVQVVVAPIPGNVLTLVGGALFGFWQGFALSIVAVFTGSVLCFLIARKLGRTVIHKLIGDKRFGKYEKLISSDANNARAKVLLIIIFLFPFLPDDLLCFVAGVTAMTLRSFTVIVVLTRPWGHVVASLLGAGSFRLPLWLMIALAAVCVAAGVLAVRYAPQLERFALRLAHRLIGKIHPRRKQEGK